MKKHIKIFYILMITGFIVSCTSSLDEQPFANQSPDAIFTSSEGFENAIRGVYSGFTGIDNEMYGDYLGGSMFIVPDLLADNLIINTTGRLTNKDLYEWIYGANNYSGFNLYPDAYKVIYRANNIIAYKDNLPEGAVKNNIIGEALIARAMAHFDLARIYAKIPTQDSNAINSIGIANQLTPDSFAEPARDPVNQNYSQIVNDLETAKNLVNSDNGQGRFNKNTANALLSRVYLYLGEDLKVINSANDVTGTVATINNFPGIWKDENKDGVLTSFLLTSNDNIAIGTEYSQTSPANGIRSEYVVSFELFNLYQANDIRKTAYFETSVFGGNNYNHVVKYHGKTGQINNIVDAKVFRMAEVMLNKAEAHANLGQSTLALQALDAVRSQRYVSFVSGNESGQALKDAIALERRLELAFEGHRFFDLKRKGLDITRSSTEGDFADGTGTTAVSTMLSSGDYKFQLPIPQDAINANPNLDQNTGY